MSEQTPDSNNGISDVQDPSMEDILASIRKIIADDDGGDGVAVENTAESIVPEIADGDVAELAHVETLDLDILTDDAPETNVLEADITGLETEVADVDALIGDMDASTSDDIAIPSVAIEAPSDDVLDDVLDLEIPLEEPEVNLETAMDENMDLAVDEPMAMTDELAELASVDAEILSPEMGAEEEIAEESGGLMGGAMAALGLGVAAVTAKASEDIAAEPVEDDLSLMLDNMLEDSASYQADTPAAQERVDDPAEGLLAEIELPDDDIAEPDALESGAADTDTDPDMDLVKSLMADLTEEPLHEESASEYIAAEAIDIDDIDIDDIDIDIDDTDDVSSDDVMDEILSMTLDDETKLSEEIAIPEMEMPSLDTSSTEGLSLKDIAAQADADAQASESGLSKGLAAGLGAAAIGGAAALAGQDDAPEILHDTQDDDINDALSQLDDFLASDTANLEDLAPESPDTLNEIHTPEPIIEETPEMPRAKKTEAIIDEVTETATAGAFASLNTVVEEKAVKAERGDRIGDLVMEALQPMLKEWLDANLKGIVERAVTKEVKRISSGK